MSKSIKKNFLYSSFLTASGYIFPLLTYPYVSRVLGVEHLGTSNFVTSVVFYFITFSMMGTITLGIREIAGAKKEELSRTFSSIFLMTLCSTVLSAMILLASSFLIPKFMQNQMMFIAGSINVLFNFLQIDWLFKGLEDFKFITVRSLLLKILYLLSVFVFVRDTNDYDIYYYLSVAMTCANAVVNLLYSRRYVSLTFSGLTIKKYLKPFFIFGLYMVFTSMYTSFNVAFLGFTCGDEEVGYYTTATKLFTIVLSLFTAFTGVMMPRMSALLSEGKIDEFRRMTLRSFSVLSLFAIPLLLFSIVLAPQIIHLISGPGYEGAIVPMQIVMPLMLIIGIEQILVIQMLMPLKQDSVILRNTILGGILGILLNVLLVPHLHSVGSAIVWLSCEVLLLFLSARAVGKCIAVEIPWRQTVIRVLLYVPYFCILLTIVHWVKDLFICLGLSGFFMVIYVYVLEVLVRKDPEAIGFVNVVKNRVLRKLS